MSLNGFDIGVIIPAYNEEKTIGDTLQALRNIPCIDRVLVVDDGSIDRTAFIASECGAEVLTLKENSGKAKAMKHGFEALACSILVFLDADLGTSAEEAIKLIEPLCTGKAEATIARFPMTPGMGGFGIVKSLSLWGLKLLTGRSIPSVLSGQRGFLRRVLTADCFRYSGFGIEFGMTADMLLNGTKILEVDVYMKHRTTGKDLKGFLHRFKQFSDILRVIARKLFEKPVTAPKMHFPED